MGFGGPAMMSQFGNRLGEMMGRGGGFNMMRPAAPTQQIAASPQPPMEQAQPPMRWRDRRPRENMSTTPQPAQPPMRLPGGFGTPPAPQMNTAAQMIGASGGFGMPPAPPQNATPPLAPPPGPAAPPAPEMSAPPQRRQLGAGQTAAGRGWGSLRG